MNIVRRIDEVYPKMTKKQKKIADYMKENIETLAFITLKDLSREIGITEMTVLNMCKTMGYSSFNEVKDEFRKFINENRRGGFYQQNAYYQVDVPNYELTDRERALVEICQEEVNLVDEMSKTFDSRYLLKIAEMFLQYPKVILCGRGISYLLCEYLASNLCVAQVSTEKVNTELNDSIYSILPKIDKDTLLVVVSFPDYYFVTTRLAEYAKKKGATVIGVTDKRTAEIVPYVDELLLVHSSTRLALNTLSAPMALMNLLSSGVKLCAGNEKTDDIGKQFGELFWDT